MHSTGLGVASCLSVLFAFQLDWDLKMPGSLMPECGLTHFALPSPVDLTASSHRFIFRISLPWLPRMLRSPAELGFVSQRLPSPSAHTP